MAPMMDPLVNDATVGSSRRPRAAVHLVGVADALIHKSRSQVREVSSPELCQDVPEGGHGRMMVWILSGLYRSYSEALTAVACHNSMLYPARAITALFYARASWCQAILLLGCSKGALMDTDVQS